MIIHKKICLYIYLWLWQCRITITCCNLRIWRNVSRNIITTDIFLFGNNRNCLMPFSFCFVWYRLIIPYNILICFLYRISTRIFYYVAIRIFLLKFSVINSSSVGQWNSCFCIVSRSVLCDCIILSNRLLIITNNRKPRINDILNLCRFNVKTLCHGLLEFLKYGL